MGMSEKRNIASAAFGFLSENFGRYADAVEMTVCYKDLMSEHILLKFLGKRIEIVAVSGNHVHGDLDRAPDIFLSCFNIAAMDKTLCIGMHIQDFMQIFVVSVSITHYKCFVQSNNSVLIFLRALPL